MEGDKERPSPAAVEVARRLLPDAKDLIRAAEVFLLADARAQEFMVGHGELICDGLMVQACGSFTVGFSLTDWPDAMLTVSFEGSMPVEIDLDD